MRLIAAFLLLAGALPAQPPLSELVDQLEGRTCAYSVQPGTNCRLKPLSQRLADSLFGWLISRQGEYECRRSGAVCLEGLGPKAAESVPALIRALEEGPDDYDTGDGVIAVRSATAAALAATQDERAVAALAGQLANRPGRAEQALLEGLGSFGERAARHWALAARILERRNADTQFGARQRELFEWQRALDIAVRERRLKEPLNSGFSISDGEIAAARRRLDRASPDYIRDFELRFGDTMAIAAARVLGRMKRRESVGVLVETLKNPHAAAQAAAALTEIGVGSAAVVAGLEQGLLSAELGPRAKSECARALGKLGSARSMALLRECLRREELARGCAEGLGGLGPAARAAAPELARVAALPSLAVRNENGGLHWSVEAGQRADVKRAALRALMAVDPTGAPALLEPLERDPDLGWVIQQKRRKKYPAAAKSR
jgi:HEAT repeat protein